MASPSPNLISLAFSLVHSDRIPNSRLIANEHQKDLERSVKDSGEFRYPSVQSAGDGTYDIVMGYSLHEANKALGKQSGMFFDVTGQNPYALNLRENLCRADLHWSEVCHGLRNYFDDLKARKAPELKSDAEMARAVGMNKSSFSKHKAIVESLYLSAAIDRYRAGKSLPALGGGGSIGMYEFVAGKIKVAGGTTVHGKTFREDQTLTVADFEAWCDDETYFDLADETDEGDDGDGDGPMRSGGGKILSAKILDRAYDAAKEAVKTDPNNARLVAFRDCLKWVTRKTSRLTREVDGKTELLAEAEAPKRGPKKGAKAAKRGKANGAAESAEA